MDIATIRHLSRFPFKRNMKAENGVQNNLLNLLSEFLVARTTVRLSARLRDLLGSFSDVALTQHIMERISSCSIVLAIVDRFKADLDNYIPGVCLCQINLLPNPHPVLPTYYVFDYIVCGKSLF